MSKFVVVWLPDAPCYFEENMSLLRRLREAGFRVFVASSPDTTTPSLFVGASMCSGKKIEKWLSEQEEQQ